jgi:hypothetical protein
MIYISSVLAAAAFNLGLIYVAALLLGSDMVTVSAGYLVGWIITHDARVIRRFAREARDD